MVIIMKFLPMNFLWKSQRNFHKMFQWKKFITNNALYVLSFLGKDHLIYDFHLVIVISSSNEEKNCEGNGSYNDISANALFMNITTQFSENVQIEKIYHKYCYLCPFIPRQ